MQLWIIYAILAAVAAAFVGIFSKVGIRGVDPTIATTIRGAVIALTMGALALYYGKWETLTSIGGRSLLFIILAGIFGGLSWLWGFIALQSGGGVTAVSAIDRLSVVLVFIFAIFFLGESFSFHALLGVFLVAIGVILITIPRAEVLALFHRLTALITS